MQRQTHLKGRLSDEDTSAFYLYLHKEIEVVPELKLPPIVLSPLFGVPHEDPSLLCVQIWDLATGRLKLSLTGHISGVRGLAVSPRQPYLFSCGEDKQVKCWDLEYNKAGAPEKCLCIKLCKVDRKINAYGWYLQTCGRKPTIHI